MVGYRIRSHQENYYQHEYQRYTLPEQYRIALQKRWTAVAHKEGIRLAQIMDKLRYFIMALVRIRVNSLAYRGIDPSGNSTFVVKHRSINQPALSGPAAPAGLATL